MRRTSHVGPWVVYQVTRKGQPTGNNVVCEQAEWDALEVEQPGVHKLVMGGFANEGEAERHARAAMPTLLEKSRK
jgi:hypothetical protein